MKCPNDCGRQMSVEADDDVKLYCAMCGLSGRSEALEGLAARSLHILQHALGMDDYGRQPKGDYRNHFCLGESDGGDWALCTAHVEAGRMTRRGPSELFGGPDSYCFIVTEAGRQFVRERSPKPPKVARARQRYLDWLRISDVTGEKFGDYLKRKREVSHG